jgi:hypothetical protein
VASAAGGIGFPQLVHATIVNVAVFSVIVVIPTVDSVIVGLPYILYVQDLQSKMGHARITIQQ